MDIINNASKPILVVGGGVRWSKAGDLIDEISKGNNGEIEIIYR